MTQDEKRAAALAALEHIRCGVCEGAECGCLCNLKEVKQTMREALQPAPLSSDVAEVHEYLKDKFFIVKNGLYYRPDDKGYTKDPNEAGLYTLAECAERVSRCSELMTVKAYRIRAAQPVETVTVEFLESVLYQGTCKDGFKIIQAVAEKYPNGLRIVKG